MLGGSLVGFRVGGNARPLFKKGMYINLNVLMIRSIIIAFVITNNVCLPSSPQYQDPISMFMPCIFSTRNNLAPPPPPPRFPLSEHAYVPTWESGWGEGVMHAWMTLCTNIYHFSLLVYLLVGKFNTFSALAEILLFVFLHS